MNNRKWIKLLTVLLISSVLLIGATQRFDRIVASSLVVSGWDGVTVYLGDLVVGNGTPDTTLNGEDVYIEGSLEVDGATNFDGAQEFGSTLNVDGAVTLNSTLDVDGNLTSGTGSITMADSINVTGAADFDSTVNIDGNLASATGALTVADTLNVTGATTVVTVTLSSDIINAPQGTFAVEYGVPITPTGYYQPITSPTSTTGNPVTDIAAPTDDTVGKLLEVHNINATQVITIDGTGGTVECKADVVLGPGDILGLRWNGDNWNCRYSYDNS